MPFYFSQISPTFRLYCSLVLLLASKCLCISPWIKWKRNCVASNTHQRRKQSSFSAYLIQYKNGGNFKNLFSLCLLLTPREAFSGVSQGPASLLFKTKPTRLVSPALVSKVALWHCENKERIMQQKGVTACFFPCEDTGGTVWDLVMGL